MQDDGLQTRDRLLKLTRMSGRTSPRENSMFIKPVDIPGCSESADMISEPPLRLQRELRLAASSSNPKSSLELLRHPRSDPGLDPDQLLRVWEAVDEPLQFSTGPNWS